MSSSSIDTHHPSVRAELPDATTNDNTKPAGTLRGGVLTVRLYAADAKWHPGPADAPPVVTSLFGEEGRAPSNPGPLLRVPLGTRINVALRNTLNDTVLFVAACKFPCKDAVQVAPGASGQITFTPSAVGTFVYYALPIRHGQPVFTADDGSQLRAVLVVDPAGAPPRPDRIIVTSIYEHVRHGADASKGNRVLFTFNGRMWPYTERFTYTVGDSVRWRLVNLGGGLHPLHLHGFYFRVESRGDGATDTPIPPGKQPLVVTENIALPGTFQMVWSPDRPGNWLFHCHKPMHIGPWLNDMLYDRAPKFAEATAMGHGNHMGDDMSGLVLGITVLPAKGVATAGTEHPSAANRMQLVAEKTSDSYGPEPTLGYALRRSGDTASSAASSPGPILTVARGQRTQVAVVNHLSVPTTVHWHGIELESYNDGVGGFSGAGAHLAPMIAPGDSFVATFTPPRAGTFIYHTHMNDLGQMAAGMYGALVVLEPGEKWNDTTDHVFAIGQSGLMAPAWTVVNGRPADGPIHLKAGVPHRFRFFSMTIDDETDVSITRNDSVATWTPLAKDAIPIPSAERTARPAKVSFGAGETYDFEFTPKEGDYQLKVMSLTNVLLTIVAE
ncbi:MAG TPA: multicopper oxidase domain-containing protein [Gemmatimonadaceae bacterium]